MTESRTLARLTWQTEAGPAEHVLQLGEVVVVGRHADNAIVIDDLMLSRQHAQFAWDGEAYTVQDLDSANGTFVNGQRISGPHRLVDGDEVRLDQFRFTFQMLPQAVEEATMVAPSVQAARGQKPRLLVRAGPDAGQEIELTSDSVTLGRAGRNATWEIRLSDRTVSRPHARVQRDAEGYIVVDLGSANGTLVNDQVISESCLLADGDVITIGETRLVFRAGSAV